MFLFFDWNAPISNNKLKMTVGFSYSSLSRNALCLWLRPFSLLLPGVVCFGSSLFS